jgi:hypothetical protein
MKRILKKAIQRIMFFLAGTGDIADRAVSEKLCDFSGQGRNEFGR